MKAATKARCVEIANEIRELAFIAAKAKNPREQFSRIDRLAREASDYFAFGFEVKHKSEPVEPEPVEFGFTCGEPNCEHDDSETEQLGYSTMREALDAAAAHRLTHKTPTGGVVTTEMQP